MPPAVRFALPAAATLAVVGLSVVRWARGDAGAPSALGTVACALIGGVFGNLLYRLRHPPCPRRAGCADASDAIDDKGRT